VDADVEVHGEGGVPQRLHEEEDEDEGPTHVLLHVRVVQVLQEQLQHDALQGEKVEPRVRIRRETRV
jgi:hypothetical protein